jgi:hypothetical protein
MESMTSRTERRNLPDALVDVLDDLDAPALRAVRAHVEQRLDDLRPTLREMIRSETAGEPVDIVDGRPYTLVRKHRSSGGGSGAGPQPLALYRVTREKRLDGEWRLHWSYLGAVAEPAGVECGNCGAPLEESTSACPRCGDELSRDGGA